jgi:hypothetical protein
MKTITFMLMLLGVAGAAFGQQSVSSDQIGSWLPQDPNGCYVVYGTARTQCLADRYLMQQDEKELQQRISLQNALEENQKLHSELLRREMAKTPSQPATPAASAADLASIPGFESWHAANRWFGSDRARTEYAILYAKALHTEQPDLAGRALLDALALRVSEVFAATRRPRP